ncbi:hypothetical protein GB931_12160 [Modestobacter sp. I12A-02628]|uniref:Uncharacterized protein n=1 Tax=Goekera deserti TaxID=2497753 RepID=A0A7K3W923_9ACTN|nr:hypothetical protein [Goekera deserti]MPQ98661.1 hypothetical protein [Goekera deserti]NDI49223.1 hypothetical protein [Goekera deserti]NEL52961.1 hypothetical protein [Goekera deserti]
MLLWPLVAVVGFCVLAVLVVVLGASSTARYEFERNQVRAARATAPAAGPQDAVTHSGAQRAPAAADGGQQPAAQRSAVGVAHHPAGRRLGEPASPPAWWLLDDTADAPGIRVVAGPFPDRIAAEWATFADDAPIGARVEHGVLRPDGTWVRRQQPAEQAWLVALGEQLDRLGDVWDELLTDDDALTTLVVEVAAALVEAGLPLHDCAGDGAAGGVCLSPGHGGVLVSWHQHERMGVEQVRGSALGSAVQSTMNVAVADLLSQLGFAVEAVGTSGCSLVTSAA